MARTHINTEVKDRWGHVLDQFTERGHSGNIWYVDSGGGGSDATTAGRTPDDAFLTLVYAISQASADNGDVIYLCEGHSETVDSAAEINVNKAGLDIIGLGTGRARPTINYGTAVAASFDINSANTLIENVVFVGTGFDNVTAMVNVKAANCWFRNCEFETASAAGQAAIGILTDANANRMLIEDCHFHGTTDAGTTTAICVVGGTDIRILNNIILGAFTSGVGGIQNVTTAAVNLIIGGNVIQNYTGANTKAIVAHASTTGQIYNNRMQILSGTAPITAAAMSWVGGNYYANALGAAGTLI